MSDTTTCPTCNSALPTGAAFCTSCGTRLAAGDASPADAPPPPPPVAPGPDVTRVDTPGLHDQTQVQSVVEPPPFAPPGGTAPGWGPPAAPPPAWTPPPAPPGPTFQPPAAPAPPAWGAPTNAAAPPAWAPATAPVAVAAPTRGGPPLAALLAVLAGALVIASVFMAWLQAKGGGFSLSGWQLATKPKAQSPLTSRDPYVLVAVGAGAVVVGLLLFAGKAVGALRVAVAVLGIAVVAILVRDHIDITHVIRRTFDSSTTVSFQVGYWLGIVGGALLVVAAVLPNRRRS